MRDWWINLSLRDKQFLSGGALVLSCFLLYSLIWSPLTQTINHLRNQIRQSYELLHWMQHADAQITALAKTSQTKTALNNQSLLSVVQAQLTNSHFASHLTQLRQAENDSVQVSLQKIDFDEFMRFIMMLWKTYNLVVVQMTATPTAVVGEVNIEMVVRAIT